MNFSWRFLLTAFGMFMSFYVLIYRHITRDCIVATESVAASSPLVAAMMENNERFNIDDIFRVVVDVFRRDLQQNFASRLLFTPRRKVDVDKLIKMSKENVSFVLGFCFCFCFKQFFFVSSSVERITVKSWKLDYVVSCVMNQRKLFVVYCLLFVVVVVVCLFVCCLFVCLLLLLLLLLLFVFVSLCHILLFSYVAEFVSHHFLLGVETMLFLNDNLDAKAEYDLFEENLRPFIDANIVEVTFILTRNHSFVQFNFSLS